MKIQFIVIVLLLLIISCTIKYKYLNIRIQTVSELCTAGVHRTLDARSPKHTNFSSSA